MQDDSKLDDLQAELEQLGAKPLGESDSSGKWSPEPGDQLAGRVVEVTSTKGNGDWSPGSGSSSTSGPRKVALRLGRARSVPCSAAPSVYGISSTSRSRSPATRC